MPRKDVVPPAFRWRGLDHKTTAPTYLARVRSFARFVEATAMLNNGALLDVIGELLGDASVSTTKLIHAHCPSSQLITEGYPPVLVSSKLRVTEAIV
jgi:hypothetical protein